MLKGDFQLACSHLEITVSLKQLLWVGIRIWQFDKIHLFRVRMRLLLWTGID